MPKKATKMFDDAVQIGNSLYLAYGFQDYDHITDDELRQFTYGNCMNGTVDVRYWWDDDETMTIVGSLGHKSIYLHEYWQPGEIEHVGSEETVAAAAVEMGAEAILKNRGVTALRKAPRKLSGRAADAMRLRMERMSKKASRTTRRIPKSAGIDLRTLPADELRKRAIRDNMKAENDAIMTYSMYISLLPAGDPVRKGLEDIVREEKLHVGELQRLLESEDPDELMAFEEGKAEVDAQIGVRSASMPKKADSYGYVHITSEGGTLVADVVVEGLFTKKVDGVEVPDGYGFGDSVDFDRNEAIEYGFEDPDDIDPWNVADFLEDNRERVASAEASEKKAVRVEAALPPGWDYYGDLYGEDTWGFDDGSFRMFVVFDDGGECDWYVESGRSHTLLKSGHERTFDLAMEAAGDYIMATDDDILEASAEDWKYEFPQDAATDAMEAIGEDAFLSRAIDFMAMQGGTDLDEFVESMLRWYGPDGADVEDYENLGELMDDIRHQGGIDEVAMFAVDYLDGIGLYDQFIENLYDENGMDLFKGGAKAGRRSVSDGKGVKKAMIPGDVGFIFDDDGYDHGLTSYYKEYGDVGVAISFYDGSGWNWQAVSLPMLGEGLDVDMAEIGERHWFGSFGDAYNDFASSGIGDGDGARQFDEFLGDGGYSG